MLLNFIIRFTCLKMKAEAHTYLTNLTGFFIRKGNKTKAEKLFYSYALKTVNLKKKQNIFTTLNKCKVKTSTYIRYIERRRGKRSKYRIKYLEKHPGEKKGLLLVGRSAYLHTQRSTRQFKSLLTQELKSWTWGKHWKKKNYKATHILAKRYAPRSWFFRNRNRKGKVKIIPVLTKRERIKKIKRKKQLRRARIWPTLTRKIIKKIKRKRKIKIKKKKLRLKKVLFWRKKAYKKHGKIVIL